VLGGGGLVIVVVLVLVVTEVPGTPNGIPPMNIGTY
jgi:hypothetical protein